MVGKEDDLEQDLPLMDLGRWAVQIGWESEYIDRLIDWLIDRLVDRLIDIDGNLELYWKNRKTTIQKNKTGREIPLSWQITTG